MGAGGARRATGMVWTGDGIEPMQPGGGQSSPRRKPGRNPAPFARECVRHTLHLYISGVRFAKTNLQASPLLHREQRTGQEIGRLTCILSFLLRPMARVLSLFGAARAGVGDVWIQMLSWTDHEHAAVAPVDPSSGATQPLLGAGRRNPETCC